MPDYKQAKWMDLSDSDGGRQASEPGPEDHRGLKAGIPSGNGLI